jgi:hypothetical protein
VPATPANTITPRRAIKNYQLSDLINLRYVALRSGSDPNPQVSGESIFELVWRSFSW